MVGTIQMSGLSGFDSGTIIDKLMSVEKQPLYKMVDKKSKLNLQKELYSEINLKMYDFQSSVFDFTLESTFRTKKTTISNTDAIGAQAGVDALNASYTFRNITLATSTIAASSTQLNTSSILTSDSSLGAIDTSKSFAEAGFSAIPQGSVTINGVEFDLDYFSSVDEFMTAVENNPNAKVADFSWNTVDNKFSITADSGQGLAMFETKESVTHTGFLTAAGIGFIDRTAKLDNFAGDMSITSGVFSINGVDFNVNREIDTMDSIIKRINASDADVIAFYDEVTEKMTFTSKKEGNTAIIFDDKSTNFLEAMGVSNAVQNIGNNAKFEFNGVSTERSSNNFEINGVEFNLKQDVVGPVTVDISTDTEDLAEKMEKFVEDYNEIMEYVYGILNEEPATDEELNAAEDIESLTELQKKGILQRDSTIRDIQDKMKSFFSTTYAGYTMEDIGLKAAGASGVVTTEMKKGLIEFDKDTFEEAMQDMPEIVEAMLRNDGETIVKKNAEIGIAVSGKTKYSLGYKNIGQDVKITAGGVEYKMVTEPTAANEFKIDRATGYIEFFQSPTSGAKIEATFEAYEGEKFEELEKNIGSGNGYKTTFTMGARNIGQNVSVVVGDGSTAYTQVESLDELTGNTYFVDRERGRLIFAEAIGAGDEVKVGFDYTVAQKGIFNTMYEGMKAYTGVGILYRAESSLTSELKTMEENITNFNDRLKSKEERLWKIYTNLETALNEMNSQSSWLSSQLANL
jgi:flagellar hook-associated protein 2